VLALRYELFKTAPPTAKVHMQQQYYTVPLQMLKGKLHMPVSWTTLLEQDTSGKQYRIHSNPATLSEIFICPTRVTFTLYGKNQ
jgi:hypothetical protein